MISVKAPEDECPLAIIVVKRLNFAILVDAQRQYITAAVGVLGTEVALAAVSALTPILTALLHPPNLTWTLTLIAQCAETRFISFSAETEDEYFSMTWVGRGRSTDALIIRHRKST